MVVGSEDRWASDVIDVNKLAAAYEADGEIWAYPVSGGKTARIFSEARQVKR